MTPTDQQLAQVLREADAAATPRVTAPLDAVRLLSAVADRRRKRTTTRTVLAATVMVALIASVRFWPTTTERVAKQVGEETAMEELAAAIAAIEVQSQELASRFDQSFDAPHDVLAAYQHTRNDREQTAEELRTELAELEFRAAATDAQLAWDRAWSRSGALRLELARHEAKVDPEQATAAYRQIAHSYAGTPWGDEAALVLTKVAAP